MLDNVFSWRRVNAWLTRLRRGRVWRHHVGPEGGGRAPRAAVAAGHRGTRAFGVDLEDPASIDALTARVTAILGGADILVHNAGLSIIERFTGSDPAGWDRMWRVNLRAPMQLTRTLLPGMCERGWGRLAGMVAFLCTGRAGYVTGQTISVSGGITMQ